MKPLNWIRFITAVNVLDTVSATSSYITTCQAIAKSISSESGVYYSPHSLYIKGNSHWASSSSQDSACVVEPANAADISVILKLVATNSTPFGIRSGGHATNPGFSSTPGVQIALFRLSQVVYHPSQPATDGSVGTVDIGAGLVWDDVYAGLEPYGVNVVGGRVTGVGVGGFTLGGGYSWLSNQYGLTIDTVTAFEVVLPNGTLTTATETQNPDLFFGLKGGFNNFGIVTKFTLLAFPQGQVWGGLQTFTSSQLDKVNAATADFVAEVTDPKAAIITTYNFLIGQPGVSLLMFYDGPTPPNGTFDRFTSIPHLSSDVSTRSFSSLVKASPANATYGSRGAFNTVSLKTYSPALIAQVLNQSTTWGQSGAFRGATFISYDVEPFLPSMNKRSKGGAYPHDDYLVPLNLYFAWVGSVYDEWYIKALEESTRVIREQAIAEGQDVAGDKQIKYGNYAAASEDLASIYGPNLDRLRGIKKLYDPTDVMGLAVATMEANGVSVASQNGNNYPVGLPPVVAAPPTALRLFETFPDPLVLSATNMGMSIRFADHVKTLFGRRVKPKSKPYVIQNAHGDELRLVDHTLSQPEFDLELELKRFFRIKSEPEPESEHPIDEHLFGGPGREPIAVLPVEDTLGPQPPVPSGVSRRFLDRIPDALELGTQEAKNLLNLICSKLADDIEIGQQTQALGTKCSNLLQHIEKTKPSSPKMKHEIERIGKELINTASHIINQGNKDRLTELVYRQSIIQRLIRCETAYKRLRDHVAWVQNLESSQMIQTIEGQHATSSPDFPSFNEVLQANEAEVQRLLQETASNDAPPGIIFQRQIRYREGAALNASHWFSLYKGEMMTGEKVTITISEVTPTLERGRSFGRKMLGRASTWASFDSKYILPFLGMGIQIIKRDEEDPLDRYNVFFVWVTADNAVLDVALGLQYLHERDEPCIHGTLRGETVLIRTIEGEDQACFNGAGMTKDQWHSAFPSEVIGEGDMCRWKAPEVLERPYDNPQMEPSSDVWSWAMTTLELLSGKVPYYEHVDKEHIKSFITSGSIPRRDLYPEFEQYTHHPNEMWALFEQCWRKDPAQRPTIRKVVDELARIEAMPKVDSN